MLRCLGRLSLVCGIAATLLLAACVRLGYDATSEPTSLDSAAPDLPVSKDGTGSESPIEPSDGLQSTEASAAVDAVPSKDLGSPDTGGICIEPQDINDKAATCSNQCVSGKVPDADCDGLRDVGQDPWTTSCNRLLFSDGFLAPPSMPTWIASAGVTWTCGKAGVHAGDYLMLGDSSSLTDASYLAEIRFGIIKTVGPGTWRATLKTTVGTDTYSDCELRTTLGQTMLHLERFGTCTGTVSTTVSGTSIGQPYLLQSYYDGVDLTCRLLSSSGQMLGNVSNSGCGPTSPGTVKVTATDCDVAVSYVRVFQVN
jgi:hypothetical protein